MRGEYWYRRVQTYPDTVRQARVRSPHPHLAPPPPPHHSPPLSSLPSLPNPPSSPSPSPPLQTEAVDLWSTKISQPGTWTWGDMVAAGIVGVQVVGAFAVGEILGRGSLIGYKVGNDSHH